MDLQIDTANYIHAELSSIELLITFVLHAKKITTMGISQQNPCFLISNLYYGWWTYKMQAGRSKLEKFPFDINKHVTANKVQFVTHYIAGILNHMRLTGVPFPKNIINHDTTKHVTICLWKRCTKWCSSFISSVIAPSHLLKL